MAVAPGSGSGARAIAAVSGLWRSVGAAVVLPSLFEGFGIPIIEAFATECPVITSNLSSMKEIAEGYALLVNPYDIDELSIAMLHMSVDKKLQKKYKCLSKEAALRFSWKETVRNTFNLIEDICSNPTE